MSIIYKNEIVAGSANVVANPTLAGTESNLTGLEVDGTKYKVPSGGGGISEITDDTDTNLNGLLKGNGSKVSAETRYVPTVTITQAAYDALVQAGTVDPTVMYVISDSQSTPSSAAQKSDLTDILATGSTNTTGATIASGTFFYLDGTLVVAKADIASGATFTEGTNYEEPTAGALNALKSALNDRANFIGSPTQSTTILSITTPGISTGTIESTGWYRIRLKTTTSSGQVVFRIGTNETAFLTVYEEVAKYDCIVPLKAGLPYKCQVVGNGSTLYIEYLSGA